MHSLFLTQNSHGPNGSPFGYFNCTPIKLRSSMVRILHMSDPHAQAETMKRLHNLAMTLSHCDVVALTGDCTSETCCQLPEQWDEWPQKLKLSVPGNHDLPHTFDQLRKWDSRAPWARRLRDLLFIGLDLRSPIGVQGQIRSLGDVSTPDTQGVVLLSHFRPTPAEDGQLSSILHDLIGSRKLLILHGHEHPPEFRGAEWDSTGQSRDELYCRSKVCSSKTARRGLCHFVVWCNRSFRCWEVQGPKHPIRWSGPTVKHPIFGRGLVLHREGEGDKAKLTADFPVFGRKQLLADYIVAEP